jgi:hypothetical protein
LNMDGLMRKGVVAACPRDHIQAPIRWKTVARATATSKSLRLGFVT